MRRIVINMQNSLFCNAIADTLRRSGNELEPYTIAPTNKVVDTIIGYCNDNGWEGRKKICSPGKKFVRKYITSMIRIGYH